MERIRFSYSNKRNEFNHEFYFHFSGIDSIREFNKNLLKNYDEELVYKVLLFWRIHIFVRIYSFSSNEFEFIVLVIPLNVDKIVLW